MNRARDLIRQVVEGRSPAEILEEDTSFTVEVWHWTGSGFKSVYRATDHDKARREAASYSDAKGIRIIHHPSGKIEWVREPSGMREKVILYTQPLGFMAQVFQYIKNTPNVTVDQVLAKFPTLEPQRDEVPGWISDTITGKVIIG